MLKINIITQLLAFFVFAIAVNLFNLKALLVITAYWLVVLQFVQHHRFYQLIKKFKWFYLATLVIFAFNTPGEHVTAWPFSIGPTYEGLEAGLTQVLRISVMLAALSVLLACNTQQQLISGFYFLMLPLKYMGLETERFAARLWLTLHYVQQQSTQNSAVFKHLGQRLSATFNDAESANTTNENSMIVLQKPQFSRLDSVLIGLLVLVFLKLCFKGHA